MTRYFFAQATIGIKLEEESRLIARRALLEGCVPRARPSTKVVRRDIFAMDTETSTAQLVLQAIIVPQTQPFPAFVSVVKHDLLRLFLMQSICKARQNTSAPSALLCRNHATGNLGPESIILEYIKSN